MSGEATIQKWAVLGNEQGICLHGYVYNHPDHPDGKLLTTPHIIRRYLSEDGSVIYVAKNRAVYKLGEVEPDYEADFPGALQNIIDEINAGVPVAPGAPIGPPGPAPAPAVIIEERPVNPAATILRPDRTADNGVTAPALLHPGTPIPLLIRSTERLPDVSLFWWRPIEPTEKTDVELDTEAFEASWGSPTDAWGDVDLARKLFLAGAAAARARKL